MGEREIYGQKIERRQRKGKRQKKRAATGHYEFFAASASAAFSLLPRALLAGLERRYAERGEAQADDYRRVASPALRPCPNETKEGQRGQPYEEPPGRRAATARRLIACFSHSTLLPFAFLLLPSCLSTHAPVGEPARVGERVKIALPLMA